MTTKWFFRLTTAVAFLSIYSGCKLEGKRGTVKIAYLLCNSKQETVQRFIPLTRYLSARIGVDFVMVPVDVIDFEKRFEAGEFSFARTNSYIYTILRENHGAKLLAAEKRGNFGSRTAGVIIARKGSGIQKLADIKGRTMAFASMLAPAGYLAEYDLMLAAGIDPEKDLGHYTTPQGSYKHEKLVYGVLFGKYDVAAIPLLDLEIMIREGKVSAADFVILAQSSMIPYCTFVAAKGVDPTLSNKVRNALTSLKSTDTVSVDGEQLKVMKAAWIEGYEELADSDYDPVRGMAKRTNMYPFQK